MQQQEKIEKLLAWFSRAAIRHAEAIEALQEEEASMLVERLDTFFAALIKEDALQSFFTLLNHEDLAVRGMAAVYAMRDAPERCQAVLADIAETPGLLGFRAQAALDMWKSGEWPR
jgi:hypothetical protein